MSEGKAFRLGWVFVSYFMIAGGLVLGLSLMGMMSIASTAGAYAFSFLGAAFGGFFAGRASPGRTIAEPAVAGALILASFIALVKAVPVVRFLWQLGGDAVMGKIILISAIIAAGGFVGAFLGEKTSDGKQVDSGFRWMGISSLISLGTLYFLFTVLGVLLLRHAAEGGKLTDDEGTTVVFLALAGSALLGGAFTQAVAPSRMLVACGAGFMCVVFALVGIAAAQVGGAVQGDAVLGALVIGLGGWAVGILGALIAWQFVKKNKQTVSTKDVVQAFQ